MISEAAKIYRICKKFSQLFLKRHRYIHIYVYSLFYPHCKNCVKNCINVLFYYYLYDYQQNINLLNKQNMHVLSKDGCFELVTVVLPEISKSTAILLNNKKTSVKKLGCEASA